MFQILYLIKIKRKIMQIGKELKSLDCRMILTSNGHPTVEVELVTTFGIFFGSCPEGKSKGKREAVSLYDSDSNEFNKRNIKKALLMIKEKIIPNLNKLSEYYFSEQKKIDKFLLCWDGTLDKSNLGVNAILPVSIAFCKAGAASLNLSLYSFISQISDIKPAMPIPCFNVINGGSHAGNRLRFQEIMISFDEKNIYENIERAVVFYEHLKELIVHKYGKIYSSVGMEGGFVPPIDTLNEGLDLIMKTAEKDDFRNLRIAIDCAANDFYENETYNVISIRKKEDVQVTNKQLTDYYIDIIKKYPLIFSIEDPFNEDDHVAWSFLMQKIGTECINIVGDDLTTTNSLYIEEAHKKNLCNTVLIKPNQIGTVSETIDAVLMARKFDMKIMISHRSGETEDTFISDFAVGIGAEYIKAGAPCRGERVMKYNQLLRISEKLYN